MSDGLLHAKGMRSRRLIAIDPSRPGITWERPITKHARLIGIDDERLFVGGNEISAYDRRSQKLLWSRPISGGSADIRPVITDRRLYVFSGRGVYEIDKRDGTVVRIFRGDDLGRRVGAIVLWRDLLITVSDRAITAYAAPPIDRL